MGQAGQLIVAIGGAIVGSFFGMPQLGFLLGSLVGSVLFPAKGQDGPRMSNLTVTSSAYGNFIPIGYGTARLGGNVIWSLPIKEVKGSSGGKGGKGGSTTYTYFWTGAVALCKGPILDVIRIWADTKLVFDKTSAQDSGGTGFWQVIQQGKNSKGKGGSGGGAPSGTPFTLYLGTEDQLPDPSIEADKGEGHVPAHRGMAYVVFNNIPLANYGNRVPDFSFEVVFSDATEGAAPHTTTATTYLPSHTFNNEQRDFLAADWNRNRFFAISLGPNGLNAFNIDTMAQYQQQAIGDAETPIVCDTNGYIYMNGNGLSNSDAIAVYDPDALQEIAVGGSSNSITINTSFSFVLPRMLIPFSQPGSPAPVGQMAILSHIGVDPDPVGIMAIPSMSFVSGWKPSPYPGPPGPTGAQINQIDSTARDVFGCAGFDADYGQVVYLLMAPHGGDFDSSTQISIGKLYTGADGFNIWDAQASFLAGSVDANWDAFSFPYYGVPVCDQGDGGMMWCMTGQKSTVINWDGSFDYHSAQAWDTSKTYSTFDGVVVSGVYYGSLQDSNQGNDPTTILGSKAWALINDPSSPAMTWSRIVKWDFSTASFVFNSIMPSHFASYPMDMSHHQSRIVNGQYAFMTNIGGANYVMYVNTSDGDITYDSGWTFPGTPNGCQIYDSVRNIIIYHDSSAGWTKILLNRSAPGQDTVAAVITNLCGQVGLTPDDLDVSALEDSLVDGYVITAQNSVRQNIAPLALAYFFDGVESEDKLKFVNRGGSPIATITQPEMLAPNDSSSDSVFTETRIQEVELPRTVNVTYMDKDSNYQQGTQQSQRVALPVPTMFSSNDMALQIPLAMSASQAINIANNTLYAAWTERTTGKFSASAKWLAYEPTDILNAELNDGTTYVLRFTNLDVGADLSIDITGVTTSSVAYSSDLPGGDSSMPQQKLGGPGAARFFLWDSPFLIDQESSNGSTLGTMHFAAGLYQEGKFPGEQVYKSADGSYWTTLGIVPTAATWGSVMNILADTNNPFKTDKTNTINVIIHIGADVLESVTSLEMLNGANMAVIYNPMTGAAEVVQFQTVVEETDGSFTLSNLLRGRRGTELTTGTHSVGEIFILLSTTSTSMFTLSSDEFNSNRFYKGVPAGTDFESQPVITVASKGQSLMPYAPVHQAASLSGSDIDLTWERRTRYSGGLQDGDGDVPLNEASEAYEIDIYDAPGTTVLRTLKATTTSTTYLAADIATDFGSTPTSLTLAIYQISSVAGRGFGKKVTIDVN
jgi:hypothetical protein